VAPPHLGSRRDIHEVDDLGHVCLGEAERLGVPVDGDDAQSELTGPPDRAPLMPARADEEDRSIHSGPMLTIKGSQLDSPPWR